MTIKEQIIVGLKTIEELLDEKGEVNFVKLYQGVESYEPSLMGKLFNIPIIREKFFQKIQLGTDKTETLGGGYLFKIDSLKLFLEENQINNTFTAFTNQIGLSKGKEFLKYNSDIVLDFPFKDCILEGGQSNDEGKDNYYEYDDKKGFVLKQDKRQEIFYNNVIAQDEITRLTEKKAFTNFKKFTKDGEVPFSGFTKDENGDIKDNLIIKGNNLLALHSLKEKFAGKVKLIYIDPPYNTGNDSFSYNDKFNHSTWLTFMKNRLEIAKELLRDDGIIFVSIDNREKDYLKVLMDQIFGIENYIATVIWQQFHSVKNDAKYFSTNHENIIVYGKNILPYKDLIKNEEFDKSAQYKYNDNDGKGPYKLSGITAKSGSKGVDKSYSFNNGITYTIPSGTYWRYSFSKLKELEEQNKIFFTKSGVPYYKRHLNEVKEGKKVSTIWLGTEVGFSITGDKEVKEMFGEKIFNNPKPEKLIKRIIEVSTTPGDIVLDYHLGSGTTCTVAHKMGRQYIGIEQMDYIETIPVERLKKVIGGEQGGISKDVEWKGGGEFVYFELAKLNKNAIETIQSLKDYESLKTFFLKMKDKYFLKYNLKIQKFIDEILDSDNFKKLPLDEQKVMLITMLDNNQLYVNADNMKDENYVIENKNENYEWTGDFYR